MKRLRKDVLKVGTYHPAGAGPVSFTADDLRAMRDNANRMVAAGWTVPLGFEHGDDLKPERRLSLTTTPESDRDRTKNHAGYAGSFELSADGATLFAEFDVPD